MLGVIAALLLCFGPLQWSIPWWIWVIIITLDLCGHYIHVDGKME